MKKWIKKNEEGETVVYSDPLMIQDVQVYNPTADMLTNAGYVYDDINPEEEVDQENNQEKL